MGINYNGFFEIGTRVRLKEDATFNDTTYTVHARFIIDQSNSTNPWCNVEGNPNGRVYFDQSLLEEVTEEIKNDNEETNDMSKKVTPLAAKLIDDDTKALMEAGMINASLELTTKGKNTLASLNFAAQKSAMIEIAKAEIASGTVENEE